MEQRRRHYIVVTNNPLVAEKWPNEAQLVDGDPGCVFAAVRDLVHRGHRLLTHPLAGSVKPNESPYRSVIVTREPEPRIQPGIQPGAPRSAAPSADPAAAPGASVDLDSLRRIEAALSTLGKLVKTSGLRYARAGGRWLPPEVDQDYRLLDADLMESAVESLNDSRR